MLDRLPVLIDPLGFAERRKTLIGAFNQSELPRLADILQDNSGIVDINISFDKEGRLAIVQGEINANLILQCQTCLGQLVWPVNRHFKLALLESLEQADKLGNDYEPFILQNEKISLIELVEDELLLALPDFPRHVTECVEKNDTIETINDESEQLKSNNPFSILTKLKNTGD